MGDDADGAGATVGSGGIGFDGDRRDHAGLTDLNCAVGGEIGNCNIASSRSAGRVDVANLRVRVRRAQEVGVGMVRRVDVVGVLAGTDQKAIVLLAAD